MKRTIKTPAALLLAFTFIAMLAVAASASSPRQEMTKIMHDDEFGGVYADVTIEEFNSFGFCYGDSISVYFSNGYSLEDIPYYNGYYTDIGEPLIVAYPGYPHIKIGFNNGDDLWETARLDESCTVLFKMEEEGKYLNIQEARNITYEDEREKFPSDEAFANFREVTAGNIKENTLYRSASPCDDQHNRAGYVDRLMEEAGVRTILDLADTDEKVTGYLDNGWDNGAFLAIYGEGGVITAPLKSNFMSQEFRETLAKGLVDMTDREGPYLIHCTEGKDRTGFACMLLEALAGASFEEIEADYMLTYSNYYGFDKETDPEKYDTIVNFVLLPMVESLSAETFDVGRADLSACAEEYLKSGGMTDEQIDALKNKISNED